MTLPVGADILLVIATVVGILSLSSIVAAWTIKRWPFVALISFVIAAALAYYVHLTVPGGLAPLDIPNAFISVVARIVN
ncbi:hypothetical protein [Jannaschia sp. CCS1]|uniref:hypothetical protein n=1 Tax=Jannaschia sp. (strain CCS1) TaxID=290400 RepID=UPI000053A41A|nr:hypothetical protein [Jannaschia sp. CCS1]ABD53365.1 hypothetical protein Jann_0448 [Jannaschia sp. CCS1]